MTNNHVLILFSVAKLQISFQSLGKHHLHCPNHTTPSIITLYLFDSMPVSKPKSIPIDKKHLVLILRIVSVPKKLRRRSVIPYFDNLSLHDGNYRYVWMFNRIDQIGLNLSDLRESVTHSIVERCCQLASPVNHWLSQASQVIVNAAAYLLLLFLFHEEQVILILL